MILFGRDGLYPHILVINSESIETFLYLSLLHVRPTTLRPPFSLLELELPHIGGRSHRAFFTGIRQQFLIYSGGTTIFHFLFILDRCEIGLSDRNCPMNELLPKRDTAGWG
uniref:Uncharacterized protein n=1 Tax=Picea glauca TaxID=3330 RepID=A0A101LVZ3_PICGL|nr:hypothetical protein ABT39_MTgene1974 [Picea glauca]QHR88020.1 hypothetical protein Q903MT_gene2032 [Picea sitchensis]